MDLDYSSMFGLGIGVAIVLFLLGIGAIIAYVFYLVTLQNVLHAVTPENRRMRPGQVWLLFIPLFHVIWMFYVASGIAESLKAEYMMRGMPTDNKPTYGVGLALAIVLACSLADSFLPLPTSLSSLISISSLVLWIVYWVQVAQHKRRLEALPPYKPDEGSIF